MANLEEFFRRLSLQGATPRPRPEPSPSSRKPPPSALASTSSAEAPPLADPPPSPSPPPGPEVPMMARMHTWSPPEPQSQCVLYARIPAEIRTMIFAFALSESVVDPHPRMATHDFAVRDDHEPRDGDEEVVGGGGGGGPGHHRRRRRRRKKGIPHPSAYRTRDADAYAEDLAHTSAGYDWLRPGHEGRKAVHTALLRTCRLVYLETHDLVVRGGGGGGREHVFWLGGGGPPWAKWPLSSAWSSSFRSGGPAAYFAHRLPICAAAAAREVHIFAGRRDGELEQMVLQSVHERADDRPLYPWPLGRPRVLDRVETLRLTFRRSDLVEGGRGREVRFFPFRGRQNRTARGGVLVAEELRAVEETLREEREGSSSKPAWWPCPFPTEGSFGQCLLYMPSLRRLVLSFEMFEHEAAELHRLEEWARTWCFPVVNESPGTIGDAEDARSLLHPTPEKMAGWRHSVLACRRTGEGGGGVRRTSWRGFPYHWPPRCTRCDQPGWNNPTCDVCPTRAALTRRGMGPRFAVSTITLTAGPQVIPGEAGGEGKGKEVASGQPQVEARPDVAAVLQEELRALEDAVGGTLFAVRRRSLKGEDAEEELVLLQSYLKKLTASF